MIKIKNYFIANIDIISELIIIIAIFSSLGLSGIYGLSSYGSLFNYSIFVLFGVYILLCVFFKRDRINFKSNYFRCICIFLLLNVITIVISPGKLQNLKIFVLTATQWLIIFLYIKEHTTFLRRVLNVYTITTFITSMISVALFLANIVITNYLERYCGIYQNPNIGSIITAMSIATSLFLFARASKHKRVFLVVNIVIQMIIIGLCMSRASQVAVLVIFFGTAFLYALLYYKKTLYILRTIGIVVIALVLFDVAVLPSVYIARDVIGSEGLDFNKKDNKRDKKHEEASNMYRMQLISAGAKAYLDKPVLGHGTAGLPDAVSAHSDTVLDGVKGGGVHNGYLQILISQGSLGFLSFFAIHLLLMLGLLKKRKELFAMNDQADILEFSALFALYAALMVYNLFESQFTTTTIITNMTVLSAGGLRYEN